MILVVVVVVVAGISHSTLIARLIEDTISVVIICDSLSGSSIYVHNIRYNLIELAIERTCKNNKKTIHMNTVGL